MLRYHQKVKELRGRLELEHFQSVPADVFHGYPMFFPWFSLWSSMNSHCFPLVSIHYPIAQYSLMIYLWPSMIFHSFSMIVQWYSQHVPFFVMNISMTFSFSMAFPWHFHEFCPGRRRTCTPRWLARRTWWKRRSEKGAVNINDIVRIRIVIEISMVIN